MVYRGSKVASAQGLDSNVGPALIAKVSVDESELASVPQVAAEKQQLLWEIVKISGEDLSPTQQGQLHKLLLGYADVFLPAAVQIQAAPEN